MSMSETDPLLTLIGHLQDARDAALRLEMHYNESPRREGERERLVWEAIARLSAVSGLAGDCIALLNDFPREPHEPA